MRIPAAKPSMTPEEAASIQEWRDAFHHLAIESIDTIGPNHASKIVCAAMTGMDECDRILRETKR